MSTAIKVENLSKIYRLGEIGTGTISRDLERWIAKIRGKEDPFLKIGQTNDRTQKATNDIVYSLQDINFEIEQGDAVGIIGRNGAGKSTLLKILSRVTSPSTGKINVKGRVASLLEVGTGFHPELTGRENIFLNGAILGMRKKEIQHKLEEIIDFSGVERYIDTPVKRYSSGMYVRLAFAVAAHLESEILIVDEVLAVGDAEFQKKCLGKMGDVSKGEGRTVLFVSHNMSALHQLCNKSILLENGHKVYEGNTGETVAEYIKRGVQQSASSDITEITDPLIKWLNIEFIQNDFQTKQLLNNNPFQLKIDYEIKDDIDGFRLFVGVEDDLSQVICKSFFDEEYKNGTLIKKGLYSSILNIPSNLLIEGSYIFKIHAGVHNQRALNPKDGIILAIDVLETGKLYRKQYPKSFAGNLTLPIEWHTKLM